MVIGVGDEVVYERAFGSRAVIPTREPMTVDTIFDLASLTKVVATTTSVMVLVERGQIRLSDRVSAWIPEFGTHGKEAITIRHLLTHMSGLRPDLDWSFPWNGERTAIAMAADEVPIARPNERFIYSDINFIVLGEVVRRVSGLRLEAFAAREVFDVLGMSDTRFLPPEGWRPRIAPTEACAEFDYPCAGVGAMSPMLRGTVHDPTARRMAGVAGHAGLFGSARDLVTFARMLLGGGRVGRARVLSPLTVAAMTSPATPPSERNVRGLGWDIDSVYSSNRGELLPFGSFGHTGFTGPSVWIDPHSRLFVVFLANRVHPDGTGDVTALRSRIATIAAAALTDRGLATPAGVLSGGALRPTGLAPSVGPPARVETGIDVLKAGGFAALAGRRVGLVTNHTGRAADGTATIDLLRAAPGVTLVALFSPEHGIRGAVDAAVDSSVDQRSGLPIHSLYGKNDRPTDEMLRGLDTVVVDLQDVGSRFYTYAATMAHVMEEAATHHIKVVVLDRPNPLGGVQIEGPLLDKRFFGFTGYTALPTRHGMTLGELARFFNADRKLGADLEVVAMRGWRRDAWFDETSLPWVNPSPNMRSLNQATLYPGIGGIEWSNISVGRGTSSPFEQIGAPWIDGVRLASRLNARAIPGLRVYPVEFTPDSSQYAGQLCRGVFFVITDREQFRSVRLSAELVGALAALHGSAFDLGRTARLFGSAEVLGRLLAGEDPARVTESLAADEARWRLARAPHLLY